VISGRVVDDFGDPVIDARVAAETVSSGSANAVALASADTDDRGEYRLAGLPARAFVVTVVTMNPGTTPFQRPQAIDGRIAMTRLGGGSIQAAAAPSAQKAYYPGVDNPAEAQPLPPTRRVPP
jgi:hypothetical protein